MLGLGVCHLNTQTARLVCKLQHLACWVSHINCCALSSLTVPHILIILSGSLLCRDTFQPQEDRGAT